MKRVKGCLNKECSEYHKTYYKENDESCNKCGAKLSYVCKENGCFKPLPDDADEAYCPNHLADRQDKQAKQIKTAGFWLGAGLALLGLAKFIGDSVKKK